MYSFFVHAGKAAAVETGRIAKNLFGEDSKDWVLQPHVQFIADMCRATANNSYFLSGKIDNLSVLAEKLAVNGNTEIDVCIAMIYKYGWNVVNEWKGCFAFGMDDPSKCELNLSIGNTGTMQAYVSKNENEYFITSQLKAFFHTSFPRKMIPLESYHYEYTKTVKEDFCFLENVQRLVPGNLYTISYKENNISFASQPLSPIHASHVTISMEDAKEKVYSLLSENVSDKIHSGKIGVPVSGGLDSGIVASLVQCEASNIHTYTIGTDFGNEFENAKEVHAFLNSTHHEIHIDEPGFWEGFVYSVWHNEICDPLYAEGYVGFYHVFKEAVKDVDQVFTGYGADLVLGDFLLIPNKEEINSFSEYWCRRAAWSGEMSIYVANKLGVEVQHPFWETELINFGLSLPYQYKYRGEEVKAILREVAEEKKLLPASIAWRKKNALTTGTSIDQLFSRCLDIPYVKNYDLKSIFLYFMFEDLFVNDKDPNDIDIQQLIKKSKMYAR
jgi:carbapenam-3-carboxylate synthase